jgi:hypothetical protein
MTSGTNESAGRKGFRLSLDAWAVIVAFALALATRLDILKKLPW